MKSLVASAFFVLFLNSCFSGQEPTSDEVDVVHLKEQIDNGKGIQLIDVRSPAEIQRGVLPGKKIYIEYGAPDYKQKLMQLDKSGSYYIYCYSGARSAQMSTQMKALGFKNVFNLVGGIAEWERKGFKKE